MSTPSTALPLVQQIRQERLRLGWTQAEIAERSGVPIATYARFERNGRTNLTRLMKITAALGLELVAVNSGAGPTPVDDPRLGPGRQRGLRRTAASSTKSAAGADPKPAAAKPASRTSARGTSSPAEASETARPTVAPEQAALQMSRHHLAIQQLVNVIVSNRLNNYTARTVVQNVMSGEHVTDADKPAFVAAVERELARLNGDNCVALGLSRATFETWSAGWKPELGIVDALG